VRSPYALSPYRSRRLRHSARVRENGPWLLPHAEQPRQLAMRRRGSLRRHQARVPATLAEQIRDPAHALATDRQQVELRAVQFLKVDGKQRGTQPETRA
jgi:hypothetical protein